MFCLQLVVLFWETLGVALLVEVCHWALGAGLADLSGRKVPEHLCQLPVIHPKCLLSVDMEHGGSLCAKLPFTNWLSQQIGS